MERGAGLPGGGVSRSGAQKVVLAGGEMPAASIKRSLGEKVAAAKKAQPCEKVPPQKKRSRWRAAFFIV